MRGVRFIVGWLVLGFAVGVVAAPGDVRLEFDLPCKYPTGLASDGTHLYVTDWRDAFIHQLDPISGQVIVARKAPTLKPHGLACGEGLVFVGDDHTGKVYAMDFATGMVEHSFDAPGPEVTGLAYADGVLYILESSRQLIYSVLPEDGTILGYIPVPADSCAGMEHDGRYLWVADRMDDRVHMVDPATGMVISVLESPGPYPAGLAWHGGQLWCADFQTDKLYQVVTHDERKYRLVRPRMARVEYLWVLNNYGPGAVIDLRVALALPHRLRNQELLSDIAFSVDPVRKDVDQYGQPCALFEIESVAAGARQVVSYTVDARVWGIQFMIFPEDVGTLDDIPADVRRLYTADGARYRIDSPYIRETVKRVVGDERNPYWIARKIYNHLLENIEYEMIGGWDVPEVILKRGTGSCSEYAFCMVALCRAAGVPARYQGSTVWRRDAASIDEPFHRWAEVYLPNYGWVPVDPSRGDKKSPVDQARAFGQLENHFLITTESGGASEHLRWGYNHSAHYRMRGYCNVVEDNFGFWEPLGKSPTSQPARASNPPDQCRPR